MKGTVFAAPGQDKHMIAEAEKPSATLKEGLCVVTDSELEVDWALPTPFGKRCLIECKAFPEDLVSSWRGVEGRMTRQVISLSANNGPSILMFVGRLYVNKKNGEITDGHRDTGLSLAEFVGRQFTWSMIGIGTVWVDDWYSAGKAIQLIYDSLQQKEHQAHLIRPNFSNKNKMPNFKSSTTADRINYIFQGHSGMGYSRAQTVWKYAGSLRNFAVMTEDMLKKIPGVGAKLARTWANEFDAEYEEYFDDEGKAIK